MFATLKVTLNVSLCHFLTQIEAYIFISACIKGSYIFLFCHLLTKLIEN